MKNKKKIDSKAYWQEPKAAKQRGNEFLALLERNLDFQHWGFKVSYTNFTRVGGPEVIYNSELCRVYFGISYGLDRRYDELNLLYGRLHAPDKGVTMLWNGDECHCWHRSRWKPIFFLEGFTPETAAHFNGQPPIIEQYRQSDEGKKIRLNYPLESGLHIEAILWEYYGTRLFELFDLRCPDLWEQYVRFNQEYYEEYDKIFPPKPTPGYTPLPEDKIC